MVTNFRKRRPKQNMLEKKYQKSLKKSEKIKQNLINKDRKAKNDNTNNKKL